VYIGIEVFVVVELADLSIQIDDALMFVFGPNHKRNINDKSIRIIAIYRHISYPEPESKNAV